MPDDDKLNELKVAFARLEGTLSTDLRHLAHDVKNFTQKLETFVPRNEIETTNEGMIDRIKSLEDNQNKAAWGIIIGWLAGAAVVWKGGSKLFGG